MSGWPPPVPGGSQPTQPEQPEASAAEAVRAGLSSLLLVLAWFGGVAVVAAVIWWQVTPLAEFTRTADNATMDEEQLSKQFGADGWFFVIAAVGGLVSGLLLLLLRRRHPILMVVLVAAGGAFATVVMLRVGLVLGPSNPSSVLASTPVGGKVPLQLKPEAHAVWYVWSIAALFGGIVALWITEARAESKAEPVATYGRYAADPWVQNRQ